jgi:hypothetical protein
VTALSNVSEDFSIETELTARTISEHQARLLTAFADADSVHIAMSDPIRIDVCGVQLIESARKYAQGQGKNLSMKAPVSADVARLLETLGVTHPTAVDRRHFWLHEEVAA